MPELTVTLVDHTDGTSDNLKAQIIHHLEQLFLLSPSLACVLGVYDMRNPDVLKALKGMSTKVQLHILYDAGKAGGSSTTVDPKVSTTAQAINAAGLKAFAQPVKEKGGHLMHDKFIVRDGASVWSGSGNFTNGGLLLQDNNFFTMNSPAIAAAYSKTFGDLGSPGHSASHTAGVMRANALRLG
jgi:hypothetical protein